MNKINEMLGQENISISNRLQDSVAYCAALEKQLTQLRFEYNRLLDIHLNLRKHCEFNDESIQEFKYESVIRSGLTNTIDV
jgi:molecular chaperone GrpE (heat shock protein)